jgi:hypothetical protein
MVRRLALPLVLLAVLFGMVVYIRRTAGRFPPPPGAGDRAAAAKQAGGRTLTAEQRAAMLDVLKGESGPVKKVWLMVEQSKPEHLAYETQLEQVFRDAGWDVIAMDAGSMVIKPGIYLLVGDDEWPSYAETAYNAFQRAGIAVKAARGYRSYSEQKRKDEPSWRGPKLAADQTYVVAIGPSPPPSS